jgi:hypothetical protein
MKVLELSRCALCVSIAAAMLAGCGGLQPPIGAQGAMPQSSANATHAAHGGSWMLPEALSDDLLYVGGNNGAVAVYSYPKGRLLGTLTGFNLPGGECVDHTGDVFITDLALSEIFEYAHGGKTPIQVLQSAAPDPAGCAIDPTTGNLAVTSLGRGLAGNVAIFPHASGAPTTYTDPNFYEYYFCGYDPSGNLYVDGQAGSGPFVLAELPKGGSTLKNLKLNQQVGWPGGVQWHGRYLAVGDQAKSAIYQFAVSGSHGALKGTTLLNDTSDVIQFWIEGHRVIGGDHPSSQVHYWDYPAGGNPTKTITRGVGGPDGMTVSLAPGAKSHSTHSAKAQRR